MTAVVVRSPKDDGDSSWIPTTHEEMCRLEVELIDRLQPPLNRVADRAGRQ